MSHLSDVLCLNVCPAFGCFNRPLLRELSKAATVAQWDYAQSADEPCSLDAALVLLHDYLKTGDRPVHLIGHGVSGVLGLLYARRHPQRVRSLTLLSVGVYPTVDWQAHYYIQRQLLRCSRTVILAQVVTNLFGTQCQLMTQRLISVLEKDLETSPSPHALGRQAHQPPEGVPVPLLACRGEYDVIVDPNGLEQWRDWMNEGDRQWECPDGRYFFQYTHPVSVAQQLLAFWDNVSTNSPQRVHSRMEQLTQP